MRVVRLIIYDGPADWIHNILLKSLPDGVRYISTFATITSVTLGTLPLDVSLLAKIAEGGSNASDEETRETA